MYSWNTTVSDHCCIGCDGTVYKTDSVIEETSHNDECVSVETSICRRIPGKYLLELVNMSEVSCHDCIWVYPD